MPHGPKIRLSPKEWEEMRSNLLLRLPPRVIKELLGRVMRGELHLSRTRSSRRTRKEKSDGRVDPS